MTIVQYFMCPVCGKTTPLKSLEFPEDNEGLFIIQRRAAAGRAGFPALDEYDVVESSDPEDEELLALFAKKIEELYENLVQKGYITDDEEEDGMDE